MSSRAFRRAQLGLRNLGLLRRRVSDEGVVHARDDSLGKEAVAIQLAVGGGTIASSVGDTGLLC